jgi:CheY-like chemotaxis protein
MSTVLLAEDDLELREVYETWLQEIGDVTIRTASDGREATEQVDESLEVAVVDRRMPNLSGDEVARTIRSRHPDCDILVVSAFEPDQNIADEKYDHYLTKPIGRDRFVATVERRLRHSKTTDR